MHQNVHGTLQAVITPLACGSTAIQLDMALLRLCATQDVLLYSQVGLFEDSNLCAIHAKRVTIM